MPLLIGFAALVAAVPANAQKVLTKYGHRESDAYMEKNGFYEHETSRRVENIRNIYHIWSSYESKNSPDGKVIAQGINSIELYFDGKRFWILGWFYD